MTNKLSRFATITLTILVGTLLSDFTVKYISQKIGKSLPGVALGMLITVLIFYPLFSFLEKYIKKLSSTYIQSSKKATGNSFWGLLIGFALAILVLFVMFASVWYNLDVIKQFKNLI